MLCTYCAMLEKLLEKRNLTTPSAEAIAISMSIDVFETKAIPCETWKPTHRTKKIRYTSSSYEGLHRLHRILRLPQRIREPGAIREYRVINALEVQLELGTDRSIVHVQAPE